MCGLDGTHTHTHTHTHLKQGLYCGCGLSKDSRHSSFNRLQLQQDRYNIFICHCLTVRNFACVLHCDINVLFLTVHVLSLVAQWTDFGHGCSLNICSLWIFLLRAFGNCVCCVQTFGKAMHKVSKL